MNLSPTLRLGACAVAAALLAGCSTKESRIEKGLDKAAAFVKVADWDKAGVEVRNVLQIEPKTARAHYLSGQIAEAQRDLPRAYGHFSKAVELQPAYPDAQVALARLYLMTGDRKKAEATLAAVQAAAPGHAGARIVATALAYTRGQRAEAMAEAQRLIATLRPVPPEAAILLAGMYTNDQQRPAALEVVEKALADSPSDLGLLQVAAEIVSGMGADAVTSDKAASYYRRALAQAPKANELWRAWAAMHVKRNELDAAEKVLRKAADEAADDVGRRLALVDFLARQRGPAAAERELNAAIAAAPKEWPLRFALADFLRRQGRAGDAERVLQQVVQAAGSAPAAGTARAQLATLQFAAGRQTEARALAAEVLKTNPRDNAALLVRGRLHLLDGKPADAIADLRTVVRDQPGSLEAVALLAQAHRQAGEPALAREVIAEAVKQRPADADLRVLLAADLVAAKEFKGAQAEVDAVLKAHPRLLRAWDAKAQLALVQGDAAGAERVYAELKTALPTEPVGWLRSARLLTERGKPELALKEYDAGAAQLPSAPALYIGAVSQLIAMKKYGDAFARVEARAQREPKNLLHAQLEGEVALAAGDLPRALRAYRHAAELEPRSTVGPLGVANVLARQGDLPGAVAVLAQAQKAAPDEPAYALSRAEMLARAARTDEAVAAYEAILQQRPDHETAVNNLAYLLAEKKGDPASLERARALAARFAESSNPSHLDSLGWIHYRLGQYDRAVPLLERAVALQPRSPLLAMHLGQALIRQGQAERGRKLLQAAVDSKAPLPNLDEARQMLALR